MKQPAIVFDLDNTLIDTAFRKHQLVEQFLHKDTVHLDAIRKDFHLISILGSSTEVSKAYFEKLDTAEAIEAYVAPLFPGASKTIEALISKGYAIIVSSARPDLLLEATYKELDKLEIMRYVSLLKLKPDDGGNTLDFKTSFLRTLTDSFDLLAVVGDRPEDMGAASENGVPGILFKTTMNDQETLQIANSNPAGFNVSMSWKEIGITIEGIENGRREMARLRSAFTNQYSQWLRDIDEKCRIVVMVATALSALTGKIIYDLFLELTPEIQFGWLPVVRFFGFLTISFSFMSAILSMLCSIRAVTARHTSGKQSSWPVETDLKQIIATLIGRPYRWLYLEGDPIDKYEKLRESSKEEQARAHLSFFYGNFGTYDPDALSNLRLFELRASNYSKLYGERIASRLLILSIILIFVWLLLKFIIFVSG